MATKKTSENGCDRTMRMSGWFLLLFMIGIFILSSSFTTSIPSSPTTLTYISNTTMTLSMVNRSADAKGTITTITLLANQQDYKWKAYVGNVTGSLSLSNAGGQAIYDWSSGVTSGEIYVSRFSNINWGTIGCVNDLSLYNEQTGLSMSSTSRDNINKTFNYTTHGSFDVGTTTMSGCKSTAMHVNGASQVMGPSAYFQEILLRDTTTNNMIYSGLINDSSVGYDGTNYDFQLIVGENESASIPTPYYFWVELS